MFNQWLDLVVLKNQLSNDKYLVPKSYDLGIKLNDETGKLSLSDIDTDVLTYYRNVKIRESFQIGFGELCFIHDKLIRPINDIMMNKKLVIPEAVQRMKNTLPYDLFLSYFPNFADSLSYFDFILPDIGSNCNQKPNCRAMPVAKKFLSDRNGIRQYERLIYDANFNVTPFLHASEKIYYKFMDDLYRYGYCSPYA